MSRRSLSPARQGSALEGLLSPAGPHDTTQPSTARSSSPVRSPSSRSGAETARLKSPSEQLLAERLEVGMHLDGDPDSDPDSSPSPSLTLSLSLSLPLPLPLTLHVWRP